METVIDVMLHCPRCLIQHIDAPEPDKGWENPPHKSHLCHACGAVWRPADVCTNGISAAKSRGSRDTWPHLPEIHPPPAAAPRET